MLIQKILVPVDFSSCSLQVAGSAAELARQTGAALTLLHVAELPEGLSPLAPVQRDGAEVQAGDLADQGAKTALRPYVLAVRAQGVEPAVVVAHGPVAPLIARQASLEGADLIVMGTHGRAGLSRALLGSVAEEVAHSSTVPVLLVQRRPRPECHHASCAWCAQGSISPEEQVLRAELDG